ncbi:MAG: hypothetical protein ACFFBD_17125 [Candidatus Hodarchaeota archaeon]
MSKKAVKQKGEIKKIEENIKKELDAVKEKFKEKSIVDIVQIEIISIKPLSKRTKRY